MSLEFNADKQIITSSTPKIIGTVETTIRSGVGSDEKEVLRVQLDPDTQLPRVGINRTGRKVEKININTNQGGSGYTVTPSVTLSAPDLPDGVQALASAVISGGSVVAIVVDNPGFGYTSAPSVTITGGNGVGASATAFLDTVAYELDVNGAIRTSTSIISDTARILNLDIDNFVTADASFRAPNLKMYSNNTGTQWSANTSVQKYEFRYYGTNIYQALNNGVTGSTPPNWIDGIETNGTVEFKHTGFRVSSQLLPFYDETGDGIYPRSITPLLGDRSDKIATTEYVLNLATNDVGGRVYVSQLIGSDLNDGRSAAAPVRTIKKACQIASQSVGVKESVIIAGGDYIEDNPISIPPDCSIVGDNLRLVIVRPANPGKHMFKFGDKNYINGITFRDNVDSNGDAVFTWDYAVTFDDKQRIYYDPTTGGDFGRDFPIGHQIFGPPRIRVTFQTNTGLSNFLAGFQLRGLNTGALGDVKSVIFEETTGPNAYISGTADVDVTSGSFNEGETFQYYVPEYVTPSNVTYNAATGIAVFTINDHGFSEADVIKIQPNSLTFTCSSDGNVSTITHPRITDPAYNTWLSISNVTTNTFEVNVGASPSDAQFTHTFVSSLANSVQHAIASETFVSTNIVSIRAEGEVISVGQDLTSALPIVRIDASQQADPEIGGVIFYTNPLQGRQNTHNFKEGEEILIEGLPTSSPDLSMFNGKQRIYKILRDADGRARRFVIPKDTSSFFLDTNYVPSNVTVRSYSHYVTLTLLNSPNKFSEQVYVLRRYQDACNLIRNNIDFIADEVVRQINDEFAQKYLTVNNVSGSTFSVYTVPNSFPHTYVSGGTVTFGGNTYNVSNFTYNNVTGVGTITTASPISGLANGNTVKVENILVSCSQGQKLYPGFSIPNGDAKCLRDVKHFLNALIRDLEYGGNYNTVEAAQRYVDGTQIGFIGNQITESVKAFGRARELAILAIRNWRTGTGAYSEPVFTPVYSSVNRYFDPTVIEDTVGAGNGATCSDVASAIDTLGYLFVDTISNNASGRYHDASYLIARNIDLIAEEALGYAKAQYPTLGLSYPDETKCKRDIKYVLRALRRDLVLGGNAGMIAAGNSYFSGAELVGIPQSELAATRAAFTKARDLAIFAMRNWKTTNGTGPTYTRLYTTIPFYTDATIAVDPSTPICANVASAITTSFGILDDILAGNGAPAVTYGTLYEPTVTYPENTLYDADNKRITPRAVWDDLPIIEASPYIQNSSIISFLGGNGCEIDGSKVTQPNSPFPGIEEDGSASYPNQGKSMVASAFTIVSFGGTGYKVVNDGYTQLVSVFVIFCADGIYADSGGYASVTNSATNFGIYALRARGYRAEAYSFDTGTITNVSETPTGRTIFTIDGLGREPLEHYVVKIDGYENANTEIEYFVETVGAVTVGPPFSAQVTLQEAALFTKDGNPVSTNISEFSGKTIRLHRPSIVNSSSHTWEFAGSGTNYNALPENGGTKIEANEQVSEAYGRVYTSGTDELGDFKVGYFAKIENRTGAITFTGTVTISEVEFLKLKGGDVVVTGFDASNTLGGAASTDSKLPTQKAVKDYITNNLGPYINKPYSTNAVPRALVELTDSGKISIDQIPALRPFSVYTVANQAERLALEGALAGDIAIQTDTSTSYILNNDLDSQFLAFAVDSDLAFTLGNLFTGSGSGGQLQATEYRKGVVYRINLSNAGSGYVSAPTVTISGGDPEAGAVSATAVATIANGQVVTVTITETNGYRGGKGYTTPPTVTFSAPGGAGVTATGNALIESRLYGDIVNAIKLEDTDTISDSTTPTPNTVDITRAINTSATSNDNWVSLSSNQIAASDITSGVISTSRLASNSTEANSYTFLRGDQSFAPVVQSIKGAETRYFVKTTQQSNTGAQTLVFATSASSTILKGHGIPASNSGVAANTTVSSVVTVGGFTTININNPLTHNIPAGTIIEFTRPASPLLLDTTYTIGNFIDSVVVVNGGTGFNANQQYYNVTLTGGTGTGLKGNITIDANGSVESVVVTNGGVNYTSDFNITQAPAIIGSGSNLVLGAKLNTSLKNYANTSLDVLRVTDETTSGDAYGTVGVARFKKSQFNIGSIGNGSVELKTGADSGLDADLLDGAQGSYYLNASNLNAGFVSVDRLSGTYNISISGQSGNTLRLIAQTNNPTSSPSPSSFSEGVVANTINNSANGLSDGGTQNCVLTIRGKGSGATAEGGVRQLSFTDGNNIWLRGSGTNVTTFGTWFKLWHSGNDGAGTGLDADVLDGRQGRFYRDGRNINYGVVSDLRIPSYMSTKDIKDGVAVRQVTNKPYYDIYVSGQILNVSPFAVGLDVNLYDANAQGTGTIRILNITTNDDTDNTLDYTIITGYLDTGTFTSAETIGTASNRVAFDDYTINVGGTYEVSKLYSDGGTARLRLGRKDGTASSPSIWFNTTASPATNYNVALVASGGSNTDGSGNLNIVAGSANAVTINNNIVWNAGNVTFATNNVANTVPLRDASGNFAAGTITANLTGSASNNVLKAGDTMTGNLNWGATGLGLTWVMNTDSASIKFYNTGDADTDARLEFNTSDNQNEYFRWTHTSGTTWESMRLTPNASGSAVLRVSGQIQSSGAVRMADKLYQSPTNTNTFNSGYDNDGLADMWLNYRGYNDGFTQFRSLNIGDGKGNNIAYFDGATRTASINNGQTVTSQYKLYVNGAFAATSKSFKISHPTKENHDLVYGSLEGPEHGVYVRGKSSNVIELPDYWVALVDENTITVQLTPIGNHMSWVEKIEDNKIFIGGGEAFYFVQAERKDIDKLEVEVELPVEEEE